MHAATTCPWIAVDGIRVIKELRSSPAVQYTPRRARQEWVGCHYAKPERDHPSGRATPAATETSY